MTDDSVELQGSSTPVWALPYPSETDPADVPVDIKKLTDRLEVLLTQLKTGSAIPGEIKMWSGSALPAQASYGHWVWADGGVYATATYPLTAGNISTAWRTHGGKADPGAGLFRVPDLRGQTPIGMDAMPGGARANRIARAIAATLAGVTGEEYHTLSLAEMAAHAHGVNDPSHNHGLNDPQHSHIVGRENVGLQPGGTSYSIRGNSGVLDSYSQPSPTGAYNSASGTGISTQNAGSGGAHENLPTTTFVPYIVKLDD